MLNFEICVITNKGSHCNVIKSGRVWCTYE